MKVDLKEIAFQVLLFAFFTLFIVVCIYPFYYIFLYSLSTPSAADTKLPFLLPSGFTLSNYVQVFKLNGIYLAVFVSLGRAIVGTIVTLFFTSLLAYTFTKPKMILRKMAYRLVIISMYVNAGLIPWYIIMLKLGMKNNPLAYVLPYAVSPFYLILVKTFIEQISPAIEESAYMDGANYFMIFRKIIIPLSQPILAAIAVFSAVFQWNSWIDNFFLVNKSQWMTLQLILLKFLNESEAIAAAMSKTNVQDLSSINKVILSPNSIRMTITMVVTLPIMLVYPFMQRYFVKGIMLGAVKG